MIKRVISVGVYALSLMLGLTIVVRAVSHVVTYTVQQDTIIQQKGVAAYNRAKCARFTLPSGCTSAQLASVCLPKSMCEAANINPSSTACAAFSTINYESCLIYTTDLAGQDAMFQEMMNRGLVETFLASKSHESDDFKNAFKNGSTTQQQNSCLALGLPANCQGPGE